MKKNRLILFTWIPISISESEKRKLLNKTILNKYSDQTGLQQNYFFFKMCNSNIEIKDLKMENVKT